MASVGAEPWPPWTAGVSFVRLHDCLLGIGSLFAFVCRQTTVVIHNNDTDIVIQEVNDAGSILLASTPMPLAGLDLGV